MKKYKNSGRTQLPCRSKTPVPAHTHAQNNTSTDQRKTLGSACARDARDSEELALTVVTEQSWRNVRPAKQGLDSMNQIDGRSVDENEAQIKQRAAYVGSAVEDAVL